MALNHNITEINSQKEMIDLLNYQVKHLKKHSNIKGKYDEQYIFFKMCFLSFQMNNPESNNLKTLNVEKLYKECTEKDKT